MSSDITGTSISIVNGTVVAVQGNAVKAQSLGSNQDGYALTWVNGNNDWEAAPQQISTTQSQYFTSNGSWTCPAGISGVLIIASGGGGGGAGGWSVSYGGGGGGGAIQQTSYVSVTPGNIYSIVIGAGGAGGALETNGSDGSPTTFGTIFSALGASAGWAYNTGTAGGWGGTNFAGAPQTTSPLVASGGAASTAGFPNWIGGFAGGTCPYGGGGGGGAGAQGNGGQAGQTNTGISGTNGASAAANTGAGGGGGGGNTTGTTTAIGGNGGSGYLYIVLTK